MGAEVVRSLFDLLDRVRLPPWTRAMCADSVYSRSLRFWRGAIMDGGAIHEINSIQCGICHPAPPFGVVDCLNEKMQLYDFTIGQGHVHVGARQVPLLWNRCSFSER